MATLISAIESEARLRLVEPTARFWTSAELVAIIAAGIRDLWRSVVDLKAEHYLTIDTTNVTLSANANTLSGVPADVHKVTMIEARDLTSNGSNNNLIFKPLEYNDPIFQAARASSVIDPQNACIYYAITGQGAPVAAPVIYIAPKVNSAVNLAFHYVPTLGTLSAASTVPIPGEADNALIAWTVAYARAKESEDRSPDPNWIALYSTEKQNLLQSLGVRQLQEPIYVKALFSEYW